MDLARLGQILRQRRSFLGLTQADVARRAGITNAYVSEVEIGTDKLTLRTMAKIADALECDTLVTVAPRGAEVEPPTSDELDLIAHLRAEDDGCRNVVQAIARGWKRLDPAHRTTLIGMLELWGVFASSASESGTTSQQTEYVKKRSTG